MKTCMILSVAALAALLGPHAVAGFAPDANAYVDASGDEVRPLFPEGHAHDLASIDAYFDLAADVFVLDVRFHTDIGDPITPTTRGEEFNPDLVFFLGFDIDADAETGDHPLQNAFDVFTHLSLGADLTLGLVPYGPPHMIEGMMGDFSFAAPVEFFDRRVIATIELDTLRGLGIVPGEYAFAAIVGTDAQPTDASDSLGYMHVVVPTPGSVALLALGGLVATGRRRG